MAGYVNWINVTEVSFEDNPFNSITGHLGQMFGVLDTVPPG